MIVLYFPLLKIQCFFIAEKLSACVRACVNSEDPLGEGEPELHVRAAVADNIHNRERLGHE